MNGVVTTKKITQPQINYIRVLAADRNWQGLPDGRQIMIIKLSLRTANVPIHELVNNAQWQQLIEIDRNKASATINALALLPKNPSQPGTTQHMIDDTKTQFIKLIGTLPQSKYAIQSDTGAWHFYQIKKNKYNDNLWLHKLIGAPGDWNKKYLGYDTHALSVLKEIAKNPWQAAQDYTAEHKECAACGAKLSFGKSIEQGFGPICIKKFKPFM